MAGNYTKYLKDLHSKYNTPDRILNPVIKEATGFELLSKLKIVAGEINEVYDIKPTKGNNVIVRISRGECSEFEKERWAIAAVQKVKVPAPEILIIKDLNIDDEKLHFCVQRKIEGEPLGKGSLKYREMDKRVLRKIINQAGEMLSNIHKITTEGFGELDSKGKGERNSFKDIMTEHEAQKELYLKIAKDTGFNKEIIASIFETLSRKNKNIPVIKSVLNHDDFNPKHIMVKNGKVTGILDWGSVCGDSPINDFAKWSFWNDDIPLEWLAEGYKNKNIFDKYFEENLNWIKLNNGLGVLWWRYSKNNYDGVLKLEKRIEKTLNYFQKL